MRTRLWLASGIVLLNLGLFPTARAEAPESPARAKEAPDPNRSPARCGPKDTPETGIQGEIPVADQESGRDAEGYNCGVSLVGQLDIDGTSGVQIADHCAYVRAGHEIFVVDVSDPTNPTTLTSVPSLGAVTDTVDTSSRNSETMRVVVTDGRAVLASANSVWDISDCENPVWKGDIAWQPFPGGGGPHDIRISHDATRIYASPGNQVVDISNLDDASTWTPRDHLCEIAAQEGYPGHAQTEPAGVSLCNHGVVGGQPAGHGHGPEENADGSRAYLGVAMPPDPTELVFTRGLRIIDTTASPWRVLSKVYLPGHSVDWFNTADGREFLLSASEHGGAPTGDTCQPHPRPPDVGWAYEAFLTEVTHDVLEPVSMVEIAINKPENCEAMKAAGKNNSIAYHAVDDPYNAHFAMIPFGDAGLRIFDIRDPHAPTEVAYFNRGPLAHAGVSGYDPEAGLIYVPNTSGLKIVEVQPQVYKALRLKQPRDEAYPRYPDGRAATP